MPAFLARATYRVKVPKLSTDGNADGELKQVITLVSVYRWLALKSDKRSRLFTCRGILIADL